MMPNIFSLSLTACEIGSTKVTTMVPDLPSGPQLNPSSVRGVGAAQGPPGVVFSNSGPLEPPKPLEKWIQVPERKKYVDFIKTGWCGMFPVEKKAFLDPKVGNVV